MTILAVLLQDILVWIANCFLQCCTSLSREAVLVLVEPVDCFFLLKHAFRNSTS